MITKTIGSLLNQGHMLVGHLLAEVNQSRMITTTIAVASMITEVEDSLVEAIVAEVA